MLHQLECFDYFHIQILSLLCKLYSVVMNVDKQTNMHDCGGLYSAAFVTSLSFAEDVTELNYDLLLRKHFGQCVDHENIYCH